MGRTNISYGAKDILYKLMGQLYKGKPLEILGVNDMPKIMDRLPRNFFENEVSEVGPNEIFISHFIYIYISSMPKLKSFY